MSDATRQLAEPDAETARRDAWRAVRAASSEAGGALASLARRIATAFENGRPTAYDLAIGLAAVAADERGDLDFADAVVYFATKARADLVRRRACDDGISAADLALARAAVAARRGDAAAASLLAAFAVEEHLRHGAQPYSPVCRPLADALLRERRRDLAARLVTGGAVDLRTSGDELVARLAEHPPRELESVCALIRSCGRADLVISAGASLLARGGPALAFELDFSAALVRGEARSLVAGLQGVKDDRLAGWRLSSLLLAYALGDHVAVRSLPASTGIRRADPAALKREPHLAPLLDALRWLEEAGDALKSLDEGLLHIAALEPLARALPRFEHEALFLAAAAHAGAGTRFAAVLREALVARGLADNPAGSTQTALTSPRPTAAAVAPPTGARRALGIGKVVAIVAKAAVRGRLGASRLGAADVRATAELLRTTLAELKGPLMKYGQLAAFMAPALPDELREALASLHFTANRMPPGAARRAVESELGAAFDGFADFEDEPFAVATIGQVHRARLRDGRPVAVKVQHPYIDRAVRLDLRVMKLCGALGAAFAPGVVTRGLLSEVERLVTTELDYRVEASFQSRVAAYLADTPALIVPKVHESLSTRRVLTSDYIEGERLSSFAANASAAMRDAAGIRIFHATFRGLLQHGLFNVDLHPGNFLVTPEGLALLDFGATIELPAVSRLALRRICTYFWTGDEADAVAAWEELCAADGVLQAPGFDPRINMRLLRETYGRPVRGGAFRFDAAFLDRETTLLLRDHPQRASIAISPRMSHFFRLVWGLHGILASLNATADWRAEMEHLLAL